MNLNIIDILINALLISCPLILLASGCILNTRAGMVNFAFDGIMCVGASLYCLIISKWKEILGSTGVVVVAFVIVILIGLVFSLLYSFATINFKTNQVLVSMALNFIGYGIAIVLPVYFLDSLSFSISLVYIKLYPIVAIIVTLSLIYFFSLFLLLTRFGVYIKSLGENPTVAAFSYIRVGRTRYLISFFSSAIACFVGALLVYINPIFFIVNNSFNGLGFLVIVFCMIGRNKFVFTSLVCIVFSFIYQLSLSLKAIDQIQSSFPTWFLGMIPYLSSLVFLMIFCYDTSLPLSWNIPYIKTGQIK